MNSSRWSIRWRLTVWNTGVLTVLFGFICLVILLALHNHLRYLADQDMTEELQELIEELRIDQNEAALVTQLTPRYSVHSHFHFQILDEYSRVIFRSRFLSLVTLPPISLQDFRGYRFEDVDLGSAGEFRLLSTAIRDSHSRPLLLQVISPQAALQQEFQWYVGALLTAFPLVVLLSLLTGYFLARRALRPLERMALAAERISAERLDQRLDVGNPHDELGMLATTLNKMFDRIQSSIVQMRQFTSDAAHELRSPIAALRTQSEVALRAPRTLEVYQEVVREALEETTRMSDLVDQLLMLSRHDSGQLSVLFEELPVDQLLLDVIDRFQSVAEDRGIVLQWTSFIGWVVQGDDVWLSQLFWNLLDNASKYTPRGGTVEITTRVNGLFWECSVSDSGVGIAPEHLPRIFDRFYRVDHSRTRHTGGTGLGLALCKSIAEAHAGQITATSQVQVGSVFTVALPGHPAVIDPAASEDFSSDCAGAP